MHETLHALGLGHNVENFFSIMTPSVKSSHRSLIYNDDLVGLLRIWQKSDKDISQLNLRRADFYDNIILGDSVNDNINQLNTEMEDVGTCGTL